MTAYESDAYDAYEDGYWLQFVKARRCWKVQIEA